jgi:enamine deaminase RidA (YjgF/YER057c/UK114 family)
MRHPAPVRPRHCASAPHPPGLRERSAAATAGAMVHTHHSASPYEARYGFARALRAEGRILVAGCGPVEPDGSTTPGDAAAQARRCCAIIAEAVAALGGGRVVRTRLYLTDPADADAVGAAHRAAFGADLPVATMVVVRALVRPEWRVEIEAEALAHSKE